MQDFQRYDIVDELAARGIFAKLGEATVGPRPFRRGIEDYVEALHATAGLARDRMGAANAAAFDEQVHAIVEHYAADGVLTSRGFSPRCLGHARVSLVGVGAAPCARRPACRTS